MSIQISKINRATLARLETLLSASAGYATTMEDELAFFGAASQSNWFVAYDQADAAIGFVRSFNQGEWSQGELFVAKVVDRSLIASRLLEMFLQENEFPSGHRLRFDIVVSDHEMVSAVEAAGLSEKSQTFFHYKLELSRPSEGRQNSELSSANLPVELAETLSNLHPVTIEEAERWFGDGSIRHVIFEGRIVAAAQVFKSGDTAEVNRIATHANYIRRGFSKLLMQNICAELVGEGVKELHLKVENIRKPAILFYENFGFSKDVEKTQIWFSKYF